MSISSTRLLATLSLITLLIGSLVLVGCDDDPVSDDPPDPEPDPSVTASFTIDPDEPEVGDEVTLDGSDSSVENADDLSFDWDVTPPSGSDATPEDPTAEITSFEADVEGDYDVTLEVSAEGETDSASEAVGVESEVSVTAAFTVEPEDPQAGDEVTLDGSGSSTESADNLNFDWDVTPPSGSDATPEDPTAEVTSFEADVEGNYDVMLEVSANGATDSASSAVEVNMRVVEISSDITEDRILESDSRYLVTSEIDIEATLTVEPGTIIEFEQGTRLQIPTTEGALVADGTEGEPILFTGTEEQPGWWDGLYVRESDNLNNQLNWTIVEYAGGEEYFRSGSGNVVVGRGQNDDSLIDITNTTLRHSASNGLWVRSNGDVPTFESNLITENEDAPVSIGSNHAHRLDARSSYVDNDEEYVYVRGGHDIEGEDVTWEDLDMNYRLSSSTVEVIDNATLTIEPGATLEFENDGLITLDDQGGLVAEGTEDEPILFTGTEEQPGWWRGIYVRKSENPDNQLDWSIVEYAGGEEHFRSGAGNVVVGRGQTDPSAIDITNTTLRHSASNGLWVRSNGDVPTFESNLITENEDAPVSIGSNHTHRLDARSSYVGNDEEYVYVRGGHDIDDEDVTWEALDVDYRLRSSTVTIADNATLMIEPGATLEFEAGGRMELDDQGGLVAEGTEDEPILFTGTEEQPGWWEGLYVRVSENPDNQLNWVIVEYAGGEEHFRSGAGNVVVGRGQSDPSAINITNSTLRHSDSHGLWVRSNGTVNDDACTVNTFESNPDGDCVIN